MGARYYSPAIGHFLIPDTVLPNPGDSLSYDRYAYVRNNPIAFTDPNGQNPIVVGLIVGALIGGAVAAVTGQNVLLGMLTGAISGALFGAAAGDLLKLVCAGAMSGAMSSAVSGGDILQGAIIGGIGAAIGYGIGKSEAAAWLVKHKCGAAVAVLSGGVVGGLSSVAMGGDFMRGFVYGGATAGISYAAGEIAGQVSGAVPETPTSADQAMNGNEGAAFATASGGSTGSWQQEASDPDINCYLQQEVIRLKGEVWVAEIPVSSNLTAFVYATGNPATMNACDEKALDLVIFQAHTIADRSGGSWISSRVYHVHPPEVVKGIGDFLALDTRSQSYRVYQTDYLPSAAGPNQHDWQQYSKYPAKLAGYNWGGPPPSLGVVTSELGYYRYPY